MLAMKVRITGGDDGIAHELPGGPVIWVEPVSLPWVVTQHHIGPHHTNDPCNLRACCGIGDEFAVHAPTKHHRIGTRTTKSTMGFDLFTFADVDQSRGVGVGIPRAL